MKSHYATISTEQPREVRPQSSSSCVVPEIPQAGADGTGGDPSSRPSAQVAAQNELQIISGKVAADHVHMFINYRAHQNISQKVQWLKGTSSRVLFQDRHLWARGYFAVTSGTITDEMINEYINEQEGEAVEDDSRFQIDPS